MDSNTCIPNARIKALSLHLPLENGALQSSQASSAFRLHLECTIFSRLKLAEGHFN